MTDIENGNRWHFVIGAPVARRVACPFHLERNPDGCPWRVQRLVRDFRTGDEFKSGHRLPGDRRKERRATP